MNKLIIIFLISLPLTLSACNYREVNDLPMVNGMGLDKINDTVQITLSIIVPSTTEDGGTENVIVEAIGETIFEAIRDLILKDGEKVYFGHLQYIIIGNSIAKDNINKAIDLLMRDEEIREDIWILVTPEDITAKTILATGIENESFRFYIPSALKNVSPISKYHPVDLCQFILKENSKGDNNVLPMVSLEKSMGEQRIIIYGGYIIKDSKTSIFLHGKQIQLFRLIINQEKGGIHVIDFEQNHEKSKVSFEVVHSNRKLTVLKDSNNNIEIELDFFIKGVISEIPNNNVVVIDETHIKEFKKQAEKELKDEIDSFIEKVKKNAEIDIFGFGDAVKRKYPKDFKKIEDNWDNIFLSTTITTTVSIDAQGSSLCRQPID